MGNYLWKQTGLKVTHFRARSVAILRPGALMSYMSYEFHSIWINLSHVVVCTKLTKLAVLQVYLMECHRPPDRPHDLDGAWWCSSTQMYSTVPRMSYQKHIACMCTVTIAVYCKCIRSIWWTLSLTWTTGVQIFKTSCSGLAFANSQLDILNLAVSEAHTWFSCTQFSFGYCKRL